MAVRGTINQCVTSLLEKAKIFEFKKFSHGELDRQTLGLEDSPKSSSGNEEEISLNDSGWVVVDRKTFKIKLETEKEKKNSSVEVRVKVVSC